MGEKITKSSWQEETEGRLNFVENTNIELHGRVHALEQNLNALIAGILKGSEFVIVAKSEKKKETPEEKLSKMRCL